MVEHFEGLLNRPAPLIPPDVEEAPKDIPINVTLQTVKEIIMAIRLIKSEKAAAPDNKLSEVLKSDIEIFVYMLHVLFREIWEEERTRTDWRERYVIKIPKKDLSKCTNYGGITLLSVPGKVFNSVAKLDERFSR
ncbi:unnamed protein product [Schistosoma rodhaini]|nr:unnamed protein product [Schistosoma rodhaini]